MARQKFPSNLIEADIDDVLAAIADALEMLVFLEGGESGGGGGGGTVDQGSPAAHANAWPVMLSDGTARVGTALRPLRVDPTNDTPQDVNVLSSALPAGAATEATLAALLADIATRINTLGQHTKAGSTSVTIASDQDPLAVTGPLTDTELRASPVAISAAALPLPAGAATEATLALVKGDTANLDASLSAVAAALLSTLATEVTLAAVKTKTDNLDVALSTRATEATLATRASEATLALIKAKTDNLDVASSTRASEATLALIKAKTDNLDVALSTRATEATLLAAKNNTDTLVARTNTLGQKTMAGSMPVTFASDQSGLPISVESGAIDPNNSSTTPLLNTQTFVGTYTAVFDVASLIVYLDADSPGQFTLFWANDAVGTGEQADTEQSLAYQGAPWARYNFRIKGPYFRLEFENNSGSDETYLHLTTVLSNLLPDITLLRSDAYGQFTPETRMMPIAGSDGFVARPIAVDTAGYLLVSGDGTAGSPSPNVFTVQGIVGGRAVPISDNSSSITVDSAQLPNALVGGRLDINNGAWMGSTAPSVGQKVMASSIPVTLASDQPAVPVSGPLTDTQLRASAVPISAATLPLPTNAATETSLHLVDLGVQVLNSKLPFQGQAAMSASVPVTMASDQPAIRVDALSWPLPTGAALESTQLSVKGDLDTIVARTPINGQATMANSRPVAIASDQSTLPISAATLPLPTGAATEATLLTVVDTLETSISLGIDDDDDPQQVGVRKVSGQWALATYDDRLRHAIEEQTFILMDLRERLIARLHLDS